MALAKDLLLGPPMPRKPLVRNDHLPYHVTARSNNREAFHLPMRETWEILGNECLNLSLVHGAEMQSLVLMPNHFHMILTTPQHDLGKVMNVFISSVTRTMNLVSGRSGHVFGGPYHWSLIQGTRYFGHALKYVYRNPVKAGLCSRVEEYPFSTLHGLIGEAHLPFPISFTRVGMELGLPAIESGDQLEWLNRPFPKEAEELIQKGLRRKIFSSLKNRETRTAHPILEGLL